MITISVDSNYTLYSVVLSQAKSTATILAQMQQKDITVRVILNFVGTPMTQISDFTANKFGVVTENIWME